MRIECAFHPHSTFLTKLNDYVMRIFLKLFTYFFIKLSSHSNFQIKECAQNKLSIRWAPIMLNKFI